VRNRRRPRSSQQAALTRARERVYPSLDARELGAGRLARRRAAWQVRHPGAARHRRHRRDLPRAHRRRGGLREVRGRQVPARPPGRRRRLRPHVPRRGAARRAARSLEHRPDPRARAAQRPLLHGDGAPGRHVAGAAGPEDARAAAGGRHPGRDRARAGGAGLQRPALRAPAERHRRQAAQRGAPRRLAAEPRGHLRGRPQDRRLRHRQGRPAPDAHPLGDHQGKVRVHVAGAVPRGADRPAHRRVRARHRGARAPDRAPAVQADQHLRDLPGDPQGQRAAAVALQPRRRPGPRQGGAEGARLPEGGALPVGRGARRGDARLAAQARQGDERNRRVALRREGVRAGGGGARRAHARAHLRAAAHADRSPALGPGRGGGVRGVAVARRRAARRQGARRGEERLRGGGEHPRAPRRRRHAHRCRAGARRRPLRPRARLA